MILEYRNTFVLETAHTTYCFCVMPTGHLEHLYYGRKIHVRNGEVDALRQKRIVVPGNTNVYDREYPGITLEDIRLEMSSYGKGDIREPFLEVMHEDGSSTSDFLYEGYAITKGKEAYETLPGSYDDDGKAGHLCVTLRDRRYELVLELHYYVYEECDVIARSAKLRNESSSPVCVKRLMSVQLDFDGGVDVFTTFNGAWAREMYRTDHPLGVGKCVNETYAGVSSNRANPFVMLSAKETTEDSGSCYGIHLIYSGNHYEAAELSGYGKLRFVAGIQPQSFSWTLLPGKALEAPEAVMAYAKDGFNAMSQCLHRFVREHIVRGEWKYQTRPVLLNSWEACYFDIDEEKLLALAKRGKEAGIELFVMDDGWFGTRDDDFHSLGDWDVNQRKLPGGLFGICEKIKSLGLAFGIWVEPEMVNVQSELYRKHPDWAIDIPGSPHSEGRNQRILDLTRAEVQDFVIEKMSEVFSSADISYVKWDMNRTFTDYYSKALPPHRQGEAAHRYVLGLYRCMRELTERFPNILFEGCASGGCRFDLGILCYFPQIWASDDTDAVCRAEIQNGYSYGYPMSVVSAHVSVCPNHQTLRSTPLETRFHIAAFGVCGYEYNLCETSEEEFAAICRQIALYKEWRDVLQWGRFYRGRGTLRGAQSALFALPGNQLEWTCVAKDGTRAVGLLFHKLMVPNTQFHDYQARGLEEGACYHFYNRKVTHSLREFGSLASSVAAGQELGATGDLAMQIEGETEDCLIYGDTLMYGGIHLKQAFAGHGYDQQMRFFTDFASRLYFMEKIDTGGV